MKRVSDPEIAELRRRHILLNVPLTTLSEQSGLSTDALSLIMTGKRRKRAGGPIRAKLPPGKGVRNVPPAVKAAVQRDLIAGRKYVTITRKHKVSAGYVSSVAQEMGIQRKRGPQK